MCTILPLLTPFFWVVKISVKKLTDLRSPAMAVATKTLWNQLKTVSLRRNKVLSDLDAVYSLERRRKK